VSTIFALWAVTASLLVLAAVIAAVGYVWATTSNLGRDIDDLQDRADKLTQAADCLEFDWPTLKEEPGE
jgi:LmbE family N-acetylglucosaminyl deacetylase